MRNKHNDLESSMKTTIHKRTAVATAVSAAILMSVPGITFAAEESDDNAEDSEVIIVTANRREQSIQDVPFNISAVSGDDLEADNIIDAVEMMRNVAGITVVDRGYRNSGTTNGVIIRGVNVDSGANGDVALSAVPTVASYINDTPLYANFILKDIELVEVLRGPQGTLYGSGSLAGTVRYRMNKPDFDGLYGNVSMSFGTTEGSEGYNLNTDVMLNVPLSDNVAFRANLGMIDNDGIVDYTNLYQLDANGAPLATGGDIAAGAPMYYSLEDADTVDIDYGRLSLYINATDDLSILLSHQYQNDEIGGRRQVTTGTNWVSGTEQAYGEYQNGAVVREPSERDVSMTALEVEWDLGFATLTSSSSDYSHSGQGISDNSGFYASSDWFAGLYYGSPRPMAEAHRGYEDEAFVQELRLVSNETVNGIDWVVGAYYMDQDSFSWQDSFMPGFRSWMDAANPGDVANWISWGAWAQIDTYTNPDNDFYYRRNQTFTDKAFFGELTYHFSDQLRATVGFRTFDNSFVNNTDLVLPIWPYLGDNVSYTTNEDDTLFKANVSYDLDENTMLYATMSEGYRRGGANAVPLQGNLAERPEWQQYDSDTATNIEFGVKGNFAGTGHTYTASVFNIDWDNPQLNSASAWGFFTVANGESATTQGVELELQGYMTEELHYVIGYAHVNAELTADFYQPSAVWAADPLALVAEDGDKLPTTPDNTLSIGLDYTYSIDGQDGMYLISQLNGYYQSDSLNNIGNSGRHAAEIDAFSLWNFSSRLSTDEWDITFFVKNIFNEEGVTGKYTEAYGGTDPSENFMGNSSKDYISLPRTIGISAKYRFE